MRELPCAQELLGFAREILREELLPALPEEKRITALMIANAMGIAARHLRNGDAGEREEAAALARLLAVEPSCRIESASASEIHMQLVELNRQLSRVVRERGIEMSRRPEFLEYLRRTARRRLEESSGKQA